MNYFSNFTYFSQYYVDTILRIGCNFVNDTGKSCDDNIAVVLIAHIVRYISELG